MRGRPKDLPAPNGVSTVVLRESNRLTTMKTLSMYLRAAKTEAEDAGESTDGMASSVSELRSEILALTGNRVDVMADSTGFKSTYQILKELAGVWNDLTDVSQANILEMIGGKRNSNVVAALLENFEIVEDVIQSAGDAEGSALAENEKYLESIQGHISEFKAEFQELSTNIVDSDIVKMVVDLGTAFLSLGNSLSEVNMLLPSITAAVVAYKTYTTVKNETQAAASSLISRLLIEKTATDQLAASYAKMTKASQKLTLSKIAAKIASGELSNEEGKQMARILTLAAHTDELTGANKNLAASLGALFKANPIGWITLAITLIPKLYSILHKTNEELIQTAEEIKTTYTESIDSASDNLGTLRGLTDEFNELSKGVGSNGENISLAADDYERYRDIVNTIADITPSLISGYDAEGNAIAAKNGLLEKSTELMEEEQRLKKQEFVSDKNLVDVGLGEKAALADYQDEYDSDLGAKGDFSGAFHKALRGVNMSDVYNILGATEWENWDDNVGKIGDRANGFAAVYYEQIVQALRQNRHILSDYLSEADVDNLLALADEYDRNVEVYNARVEEYSKALNPTLQYVPQTLTSYNDLSDAQKEFLTSYINSFRITAETTEEDILQMKRDILAFTDFIAENGDMGDMIRVGMSIKYGTDENGNSLSVDDYQALIDQFEKQLSGYDTETQVRIKAAFGIETDDDQINDEAEKAIEHVRNLLAVGDGESIEDMIGDLTLDEVMQIYYNISAAPNSMTMDELLQKLDELKASSASTAASSLINTAAPIQKNITALSDALDDFKESGSLSGSALSELTEVFGALPSFDAAANTLASTSTTAAEAKAALEQLAKEYLESGNTVSSILDQLTEDNKELTTAMLEQMGVANADQLVLQRLNAQNVFDNVTEATKDATIAMLKQAGVVNAEEAVFRKLNIEAFRTQLAQAGITDYASDAADKLAAESEDAAAAALALKALRLESIRAKIASTDFAAATVSDIDALLKEATAAGYASRSLQMLYTIKLSIQNHGKYTQGMTGSEIKEYIGNLQNDINKDLNDTSLSLDFGNIDFNIDIAGLGDGSGTSALEKYTADIDEFREALDRLNRIQLNKELLELDLSHTDDLTEQIRLERDLANVYEHEAQVVKELIGLRTASIQDKISTLQQRGFDIEYNAEKNWLYVRNLEHINELQKGGTESTNEYRKETEELIEAVEELNEENQEAVSTWKELEYSIREAKEKVIENLKAIVSETSEAIDSIQSVYDALKEAADEYAANDGFISVDAYQKIVELGPQYMQYLRDENGLLVINEENINKVIAAKTQQLALEQAMTYVERLRLALNDDSIEDLNNLLYATVETTNATWGLVYANLALLNLSDGQRAAALHNINAIRAMADNAIEGLGRTSGSALDTLNDMKSGLDDILEYVMDMLQDEIDRQIDALEDEKDAYADLIDLKKKSLEETEKETDYQDEVAAKIKEIAKLQERISALSLDNSRDAQVKKIALEEEMADLQKELADYQADYARDAQQDSLDQMQEAYEEEKDKEIEALEESISSQQKLWSKAIDYIQNNWSSLYADLISWNTEYGTVLNDEISTAWDNCLAAAQRYGSYVNALQSIDADIESASGESNNVIVGSTNYDSSYGNDDMVHAIIKQMYENMNEHGGSGSSTSKERKKQLSAENLALGEQLHAYGINAYRDENGTWWTDPSKTKKLFEAYKQYTYHTGGIAGDNPTAKQKEIFAKLEEGEAIFNDKHQAALWKILNFTSELGERFKSVMSGTNFSSIFRNMQGDSLTPAKTETTQQTSIHFGDVYVYGGNEKTVEAHREVNRQFANEVLKQLNIKR